MTTRISAIEHAQQMAIIAPARPTYGYYRQTNGWITCSPITDLEELKYRRERWEPLPQYGRVEMTSAYMADHPLEVLFMYGGAHELPVAQVIEQALWMNPQLVPTCRMPISQDHKMHRTTCWVGSQPAVFPQVPPDTPMYFACRFCDARKPTEKARNQHESVMHKEEQGDLRTGQTMAEALIRGFGGQQPGQDRPPPVGEVEDSPGRDGPPSQLVTTALEVLTGVGLTKRQLEALRKAGLELASSEHKEEAAVGDPDS